jgi:hypothetical protein
LLCLRVRFMQQRPLWSILACVVFLMTTLVRRVAALSCLPGRARACITTTTTTRSSSVSSGRSGSGGSTELRYIHSTLALSLPYTLTPFNVPGSLTALPLPAALPPTPSLLFEMGPQVPVQVLHAREPSSLAAFLAQGPSAGDALHPGWDQHDIPGNVGRYNPNLAHLWLLAIKVYHLSRPIKCSVHQAAWCTALVLPKVATTLPYPRCILIHRPSSVTRRAMRTTAQPLRTTAKLSPGTSASATRLLFLGTHAKSLGYKFLLYSGALAAMSMQFARFVRDVKPRWICTSARTFTTHPHTCSCSYTLTRPIATAGTW